MYAGLSTKACRLCGATVARLTPDQKVACSNHVRVTSFYFMLMNSCYQKLVTQPMLRNVVANSRIDDHK